MDPRLVDRVQLAQAGDRQAFSQLFEQLHPAVLNYAYQVLGDGQSTVCLAQDAFVVAHQRRTLGLAQGAQLQQQHGELRRENLLGGCMCARSCPIHASGMGRAGRIPGLWVGGGRGARIRPRIGVIVASQGSGDRLRRALKTWGERAQANFAPPSQLPSLRPVSLPRERRRCPVLCHAVVGIRCSGSPSVHPQNGPSDLGVRPGGTLVCPAFDHRCHRRRLWLWAAKELGDEQGVGLSCG